MASSEPRPLPALNEPRPPPPRSPQRPASSRLPLPRLSPSRAKVTFCVRGVVSPVLVNLFMHYVFDVWMTRTFPGVPWCRYADDGLVHCKTEVEAHAIKAALQARLATCGLEINPEKTHIAYCKDAHRKAKYPITKFDFLGYSVSRRELQL